MGNPINSYFQGLGDTHAHISSSAFDLDRDEVIAKAKSAGLKFIVDVAVDIESANRALKLSQENGGYTLPTIGIHPEVAVPGSGMYDSELSEELIDKMMVSIRSSLNSPDANYSMIGECGLDYYWLKKNDLPAEEVEKSKSLQKYLFREQVKVAKEFRLPLTIHSRDAFKDCVEIVEGFRGEVTGIFHSFTYGYKKAKRVLELGFGIGINGIATYEGSDLKAVIDRLMGEGNFEIEDYYKKGIFFETDSPYLTPETHRGQRNEPSFLIKTVEEVNSW